MAPGLEQEVVQQVFDEGNNEIYLWDKVEGLRELGFTIDDRKVKTEIERYNLLQAYDSQNNSKKKRRKRVEENFRILLGKKLEELKEKDPSIIDGFVIYSEAYDYCFCDFCGKILQQYDFFGKRLKKTPSGIIKTEQMIRNMSFRYCFNCGNTNRI